MKITDKKNYSLFLMVILLALEAVLFFIGNNRLNFQYLNEEKKLINIQNILADVPVKAKAFSVYDATSGIKIYGKNDAMVLPLASLAKIMTVVVSLNEHNLNDKVAVSVNAVKQEGDYGLFVGEKFNIKDLAEFTLIGSANDGAYVLAESENNINSVSDLLLKMNQKALKIGMENALFLNSTGLDIDSNTSGAYASAKDVNIMAMFALADYPEVFKNSILPEIKIKSEAGLNHEIENTNIILDKIPNILFSKTGYTPLAGGNLVVIYKNKNGHIIVITVLGSSIEGRFTDMENIINTLYNLNYGSRN